MYLGKNKAVRVMLLRGLLDMLPLNLAVLPWGILCGSLAIQKDFSILEALLMPMLVFAGAVQLVTIELIAQNVPLFTILFTTLIISSRHFLYGLALRNKIKCLSARWRYSLGFLLTDELFALSADKRSFKNKLRIMYAFSAGASFYICWQIWNIMGIILGQYLPDLTSVGLDFAIAATFIALVIPTITTLPIMIAVCVSAVFSVIFHLLHWQMGLVIAAMLGMYCGYATQRRISAKLNINESMPK